MTIPGKGGRPRKWRSEADRRRAWRARQTGADEPPTVIEALDDGDELAHVWEIVRGLGEQLDCARTTIDELRHERDQACRELDRERRRFGWIESYNTGLEAECARLEGELADRAVELAEAREQVAALGLVAVERSDARLAATSPPTLSRAQRRQLERQQRRRGI